MSANRVRVVEHLEAAENPLRSLLGSPSSLFWRHGGVVDPYHSSVGDDILVNPYLFGGGGGRGRGYLVGGRGYLVGGRGRGYLVGGRGGLVVVDPHPGGGRRVVVDPHLGGGGGRVVVDPHLSGVVGGGGGEYSVEAVENRLYDGVMVDPYHNSGEDHILVNLYLFGGGGGGRGGLVGVVPHLGGGGGRVVVDPHLGGGGGRVVADLHLGGGGGRVVADPHLGGGGGFVVVPAMDGEGGEHGVNEFGPARCYVMILAPSDLTLVLELPVDFGDYLYNDRAAPAFITVRESLDENSPPLNFDVRYRAYKHRAYVTKTTWSGFAIDHGLQAGDEISFKEHGDAFLLTAQRNGAALW